MGWTVCTCSKGQSGCETSNMCVYIISMYACSHTANWGRWLFTHLAWMQHWFRFTRVINDGFSCGGWCNGYVPMWRCFEWDLPWMKVENGVQTLPVWTEIKISVAIRVSKWKQMYWTASLHLGLFVLLKHFKIFFCNLCFTTNCVNTGLSVSRHHL